MTVAEDDEETVCFPEAGTVYGDVAAWPKGPGTVDGEEAAWSRGPGTADDTMAEAVAPLEDEMVERVRPEAGKLEE